MSRLADSDISAYEGLIFRTAAMYAPLLDDDLEDVQQILRLKVWQARRSYDPSRATQHEQAYVFMCLRNRVKDLLKEQDRRNERRGGIQLHIEDIAEAAPGRFEARHLSMSEEEVYAEVEEAGLNLPSTLTWLEQQVVVLLMLDFNQTEIARRLQVGRQRVREAHAAVQEKMADWRPSASEALHEPLHLAA